MTSKKPTKIRIRPVMPRDLAAVVELIAPYMDEGKLLPRTTEELEDLLPHGFVAVAGRRIVGCAALEIYSPKLAEIRSLAVALDQQGQGIGKQLVEACVHRAQEKNVLEVMAITSSEQFFKHCGFNFTLPGEKKALFIQTRDL